MTLIELLVSMILMGLVGTIVFASDAWLPSVRRSRVGR